MNQEPFDLNALKSRLKSVWTAGDFGQIAQCTQEVAESLLGELTLGPETKVLDVACGTGNFSVLAARAGAAVTGLDLAPNLVEQARRRAAEEGLDIRFDEGDAEALPYPDARFDVVVTIFGAMFAPRPSVVAAELIRACRPGGRIFMVNWTPQGFIGQVFRTTGKHVAPPAGMPSPILWGDEATVRERLADGIADLRIERRLADLRFPFTPEETVEFFRRYYGPTNRAFAALDPDGQSALRRDLENVWTSGNEAGDGTTRVKSEYLLVSALRR